MKAQQSTTAGKSQVLILIRPSAYQRILHFKASSNRCLMNHYQKNFLFFCNCLFVVLRLYFVILPPQVNFRSRECLLWIFLCLVLFFLWFGHCCCWDCWTCFSNFILISLTRFHYSSILKITKVSVCLYFCFFHHLLPKVQVPSIYQLNSMAKFVIQLS